MTFAVRIWLVAYLLAVSVLSLQAAEQPRLRILVIGRHPDDPESCAGGLLALAISAGFDVTSVYLTTGEAGIAGKRAGIRRKAPYFVPRSRDYEGLVRPVLAGRRGSGAG